MSEKALVLSFALMLAAASPAFPQQAPPSSERAKHVEALVNAAAALINRWRVDIIRHRAEHLGTIEAANEKEAIEKAAKEFDIAPERRNRLVAQKIAAKG